LARISYRCIDSIWRTMFNVHVSSDAEIGPGLCLIHAWSVLIGPASIGSNCLIFHEVTLGTNANSRNQFPVIGNTVDIYVGARVLGQVAVEDDAKIGANSVVLSRVPRGSTVAPPASRIISAAAVAAFGPRPTASVQEARDHHDGAKLADE
jgi:serine O-acetyltransferase